MALLLILGLLLFGAAAVILMRAALVSRVRVSNTVDHISDYGVREIAPAAATKAPTKPRSQRLASLVDALGRAVSFDAVPARLLRSGGLYSITAERFQGYRVLLSVACPGLLLMLTLAGGHVTVLNLLLVFILAAICWLLLPRVVRTRGQRRLDAIDRELPHLIDVLTATVEAGLGFAGSLQLVADRFEGPLGQELRLMLREQSMGLSSAQALENLLGRCETPSVRAFVRAVNQGETLGVSIGQMLRNLAVETRKRRSQKAREQMMKAPVKMLFPLVLFFLPALFIVIMYPAASSIVHSLGVH